MIEARRIAVEPFVAKVHYRRDGRVRELGLPVEVAAGSDWRGQIDDGGLRLELEVECGEGGLTVTGRVTALVPGLHLDRVEAFDLTSPTPLRDPAVYHQGWQSWSATCAVNADGREPRARGGWRVLDVLNAPHPAKLDGAGHVSSEAVVVVSERDGSDALLLGFVTGASAFACFEARIERSRHARIHSRIPFDGVELELGASRELEVLRVMVGTDASELLEAWADELGARMRARVPEDPLVGWCSWYEYFTSIDAGRIRANLREAVGLGEALPIDLFQIDDGYQAALGDWLEPNSKFPEGVAPLAAEIGDAGYVPGLWLAPFVARPESRLMREHPDWFVRDPRGRARYALYNPLWGLRDTARALDTTHPEVLDWLEHLFRTITEDGGFRFLKIDFLYAAALPGIRRDPRQTGAEALRRGLEVIRGAVGEEVHILGCGAPLTPSIGLVDSMRIGVDVAPHWSDPISKWIGRDFEMPSAKNALRNVMTRAHQHGRLWQNDPDCLLMRARRTRLDLVEVQTLATVVALSGGTVLLSDDLTRLERERLPMARQAIEISRELVGSRPRTLDLMAYGFPTLLWAERRAGGGYLAVVNPLDRAVTRSVSLAAPGLPEWARGLRRVDDVWQGSEVAVRDGRIEVGPLAAHGARLYRLDSD